ncbi:hypothetical protein CABS01_05155 [Colletotrichum abscissum]|uniref:uncharacterized protein n=1 Tax=Colletotrichum abscissum TaxID=1671311 RepID=UPI0027D4BE1B|nr:uncharacterized protein CABS01_05155 [Colletotrichum abscissum]KAK1523534.1 hypothetical protein CABS01_05155 [Colletotrichum abscissum]KAK1714669.1 hypothetical protein BDP67DRAFT_24391 [Colletotrichum lupini]
MHHAAPTRPLVLLVSVTHTALAGHLGICNLSSEHTLKRVKLERGCFVAQRQCNIGFLFPSSQQASHNSLLRRIRLSSNTGLAASPLMWISLRLSRVRDAVLTQDGAYKLSTAAIGTSSRRQYLTTALAKRDSYGN